MNAQEHEVVDTIRQYVACAKTMDFAGRKALWDHDEPLPILCPEEATQPLVGWEALDAYWSRSRVTMADLKALATYDNRWIAHMAGPTEEPAISADVRMNALLRRKPEGWRYFQLVEGPVDLMTMARQAARRSALELFPELE